MPKLVNIKKSVMAADEEHASFIRNIMREKGILMINMIGSPGSGKTTVLEKLLPALDLRCAVIEGDVATSKDAERIAATGTPVVQINTQGGCHLEAHLVRKALQDIPIDDIDVLLSKMSEIWYAQRSLTWVNPLKWPFQAFPKVTTSPSNIPHYFTRRGLCCLQRWTYCPL